MSRTCPLRVTLLPLFPAARPMIVSVVHRVASILASGRARIPGGIVSGKVPAIRHLAFFDALAEMDEEDASWRAVSAGLVVLRLLDAWLEEGPQTVAPGA